MNQTVLQEFFRGSQYFLHSGKVVSEDLIIQICHKILLLLLSTAKRRYKNLNLQSKLSSTIFGMHYLICYLNSCFSTAPPLNFSIYRESFLFERHRLYFNHICIIQRQTYFQAICILSPIRPSPSAWLWSGIKGLDSPGKNPKN